MELKQIPVYNVAMNYQLVVASVHFREYFAHSVHLLRRMIKLLLFLSQNVQTFIVQTMTLKSAVFCKKQNGNLNCTFFNLLHTEQ